MARILYKFLATHKDTRNCKLSHVQTETKKERIHPSFVIRIKINEKFGVLFGIVHQKISVIAMLLLYISERAALYSRLYSRV